MIEYEFFEHRKVSKQLRDGWELYGSPIARIDGIVAQAMTKGNASTVRSDDYTSPTDDMVKRNVELVTENEKMRAVLEMINEGVTFHTWMEITDQARAILEKNDE